MDFPELALLVWNREPSRPIPDEEAEAALVERLKRLHGKGFLLAAA